MAVPPNSDRYSPVTNLQALTDIVVTLGLFLLVGVLAASWAVLFPPGWRMLITIGVQGTLLIAVVRLVLAWRRQSWMAIRITAPAAMDVPHGALAFAACLGLNMVFVYTLYWAAPEVVETHTARLGSIAQLLSRDLSLSVLAAMLAFVAVYEELFARGLLLSRCQVLMRGAWGPVLISSLLFGLGHLYQGWIGVGQTTLVGVVLALATLRWGTIWPAIVAHALLDISSVLFMGGLIEHGG